MTFTVHALKSKSNNTMEPDDYWNVVNVFTTTISEPPPVTSLEPTYIDNITINTDGSISVNQSYTINDSVATVVPQPELYFPPYPPKIVFDNCHIYSGKSLDGSDSISGFHIEWSPIVGIGSYKVMWFNNQSSSVSLESVNKDPVMNYRNNEPFFSKESDVFYTDNTFSYTVEDPVQTITKINIFVFSYDKKGNRCEFPPYMLTGILRDNNKVYLERTTYSDSNGKYYFVLDDTQTRNPPYGINEREKDIESTII